MIKFYWTETKIKLAKKNSYNEFHHWIAQNSISISIHNKHLVNEASFKPSPQNTEICLTTPPVGSYYNPLVGSNYSTKILIKILITVFKS